MTFLTFAAIDVGSNEISMKLYQMNKKIGIQELDYVRHAIALGSDTYTNGKISHKVIDQLCEVLSKFKLKMKEYDVREYSACATSGLREASNHILVIDQIKLRTGIKVKILSNSEQRFLCYKALSLREEAFEDIISKGTAIIDVGAGSIQISIYNKSTLQFTQNITLGSLRIRELLSNLERQTTNYNHLILEYIENDLATFYELLLKSCKIKTIIGFGDQVKDLLRLSKKLSLSKLNSSDCFRDFYMQLNKKTLEQLSRDLSLSKEQASLLLPTAMIYQRMMDKTKAESIYFSAINLCDGMVADFTLKKDCFMFHHCFEQDILEASRFLARRYQCNEAHISNVEHIALKLFDSQKKLHGLEKRERLYLQIGAILHSCGAFINMNEIPRNSYHIIMSSEIIGISLIERELIANLVCYTTKTFPPYSKIIDGIDKDTYLTLAKLSAILQLANSFDVSYKQKIKSITTQIKENTLFITVDTIEDISLEKEFMKDKADFFEEVYGIRPIVKQKRSISP